MLCAIAAERDHKIDTVRESSPRSLAGMAVAVRHADVPSHVMFVEHIIEDVEDGLILAGGGVDDHVYTPIRDSVINACPASIAVRDQAVEALAKIPGSLLAPIWVAVSI